MRSRVPAAAVALTIGYVLLLSACDNMNYPYFAIQNETQPGAEVAGTTTVLDKDTSVILYFDSSGSMAGLLLTLQAMIAPGGPLYNKLNSLYGADYPNKVFLQFNGTEDTLAMLALQDIPDPRPAKCVVFVFQDENTEEDVSLSSAVFQNDMGTLHSRIDSEFQFYRGVVVQVDDGQVSSFEATFKALENGTAPYDSPENNLTQYTQSDPPKIMVLYQVPESDAAYYSDLTVETLRGMGVEVP